MRRLALAGLAVLSLGVAAAGARAAETSAPPKQQWSFDGIFGTFDQGALQRGFQVYKEVCSACHAMSLMAYRHLGAIGFSEDQVKAIAATVQVTDGPNDEGEMFERPGRPSDRFKAPFPNEKAARAANSGAYPPDLSVITKARAGGADYVYAILTGYGAAPADFKLQEGMSYNEYFPDHQIAMPQPLTGDGQVEFADGTKATVPQMAHDLATFLSWAAEPKLEARKHMGVKVILFLIALTLMLYAVKRKVWAGVH